MRLFLVALLLFSGCVYQPMKKFRNQIVGDRVYTKVRVYMRDPRNAIYIKNAINEAVIERFGSHLSDKEHADTKIEIRVKRVGFSPLSYDRYGYAKYYRTTVTLEFIYERNGVKKRLTTNGFYDFGVDANSVITDTLRFEAIKESANKAIDQFIARIYAMGAA